MDTPEKSGFGLIPADDPGVTVGVVPVVGPGFRVGLMMDGRLALMAPAKARRLAKSFESGVAKAAGIDWIAEALREAADNCEARCAIKH